MNICTRTRGPDYDLQPLVVVLRQIVSRKSREYPNTSNERSERMSTQTTQTAETVKDVRVLVSFHAVREDGNVSNEPLHK